MDVHSRSLYVGDKLTSSILGNVLGLLLIYNGGWQFRSLSFRQEVHLNNASSELRVKRSARITVSAENDAQQSFIASLDL